MGGDMVQFSEKDVNDGKVFAAVGYWALCCIPLGLVPIFAAKDNAYAKFHGKQGIVLWGIGLGVALVLMCGGMIAGKVFAPLACVMSIVQIGWAGAILVMSVLGMVNALQGQSKLLPLIGQLGEKVPL